MKLKSQIATLCSSLGLLACATPQADPLTSQALQPDPIEGVNRKLFAAHQVIDKNAFGPTARAYRDNVPAPVRGSIRSFLANLREPITFGNDILQGKLTRASDTFLRFMVNSTVGLGGLFDIAANNGLRGHREDFGQTLAFYGVPPGPYIFIPALGPTNLRDLIGRGVDNAGLDPFAFVNFGGDFFANIGRNAVEGIDVRAEADVAIDNVLSTAVDPYVAFRSLYGQDRRREIFDGNPPIDDLPEFDEVDPEAPEPESSAPENPPQPSAPTNLRPRM